jgi:hypothetical protein
MRNPTTEKRETAPWINYPVASGRVINSITSHRRRPVSTNEPLDSGMRRNDDIRSKLHDIRSKLQP